MARDANRPRGAFEGLHRSPDARDEAREERRRARERHTGEPAKGLLGSRWGRALVSAAGLLWA
jgi:hypothetical protein